MESDISFTSSSTSFTKCFTKPAWREKRETILEKTKSSILLIVKEIQTTKSWKNKSTSSSLNYLKQRISVSQDGVHSIGHRLIEIRLLLHSLDMTRKLNVNKVGIVSNMNEARRLLTRPEHFPRKSISLVNQQLRKAPLLVVESPWEQTEYKYTLTRSLQSKLLLKAAFVALAHYRYVFSTAKQTSRTWRQLHRKKTLQICFKAILMEYFSSQYIAVACELKLYERCFTPQAASVFRQLKRAVRISKWRLHQLGFANSHWRKRMILACIQRLRLSKNERVKWRLLRSWAHRSFRQIILQRFFQLWILSLLLKQKCESLGVLCDDRWWNFVWCIGTGNNINNNINNNNNNNNKIDRSIDVALLQWDSICRRSKRNHWRSMLSLFPSNNECPQNLWRTSRVKDEDDSNSESLIDLYRNIALEQLEKENSKAFVGPFPTSQAAHSFLVNPTENLAGSDQLRNLLVKKRRRRKPRIPRCEDDAFNCTSSDSEWSVQEGIVGKKGMNLDGTIKIRKGSNVYIRSMYPVTDSSNTGHNRNDSKKERKTASISSENSSHCSSENLPRMPSRRNQDIRGSSKNTNRSIAGTTHEGFKHTKVVRELKENGVSGQDVSIAMLLQLLHSRPTRKQSSVHSNRKLQAWRLLFLCHRVLSRLAQQVFVVKACRKIGYHRNRRTQWDAFCGWKNAFQLRRFVRKRNQQANSILQLCFLSWKKEVITQMQTKMQCARRFSNVALTSRCWNHWLFARKEQELGRIVNVRYVLCVKKWLKGLLLHWKNSTARRRNCLFVSLRSKTSRMKECFDAIKNKAKVGRLLRRVFRIYSLAWDYRMYCGPSNYQRLSAVMSAWWNYTKDNKKLRSSEASAKAALLFRASTLLGTTFYSWCDFLSLRKKQNFHANYLARRRLSASVRELLHAWYQLVKNKTIILLKVQEKFETRWKKYLLLDVMKRWSVFAKRNVRLKLLQSSAVWEIMKLRRCMVAWKHAYSCIASIHQLYARVANRRQLQATKTVFQCWRRAQSHRRRLTRGFHKLTVVWTILQLRRAFHTWPGRDQVRRAEEFRRLSVLRGRKRIQLVDVDDKNAAVEQKMKNQIKDSMKENSKLDDNGEHSEDKDENYFVKDRGNYVLSFLMKAAAQKPTFRQRLQSMSLSHHVPISSLEALCQAVLFAWKSCVETCFRLKLCHRRAQWLVKKRVLARCMRTWAASTPKTAHRVLLWAQKSHSFLDKMSTQKAIQFVEFKRNNLPLLDGSVYQ